MKVSNEDTMYSCVKGTCLDMCPIEERTLREKERLIHVLETSKEDEYTGRNGKVQYRANPKLMIKCFHRSAAGSKMNSPETLRPASVLIQTVDYLLDNVMKSTLVSWCEVYNFIADRLRSIKQDAIIQQIDLPSHIAILEKIARFYVESGYRQCDHPKHKSCIDKYLNTQQLKETLHQCIDLYDDVIDDAKEYSPIRIEVECTNIVLHIKDYATLHRALQLKPHTTISTCLSFALSFAFKSYTNVFNNISKLPPTAVKLFVFYHLPDFRRNSLQILLSGFNSKNSNIPLEYIKETLKLKCTNDAEKLCRHYGLTVDIEKSTVLCLKSMFHNNDTPLEHNMNNSFLEV